MWHGLYSNVMEMAQSGLSPAESRFQDFHDESSTTVSAKFFPQANYSR